jgi:MinD superfamily P-loop ATPase
MKLKIDVNICIACGLCREVCPENAVHPMLNDAHHKFEVVSEECTGCGDCLSYCVVPDALVELKSA